MSEAHRQVFKDLYLNICSSSARWLRKQEGSPYDVWRRCTNGFWMAFLLQNLSNITLEEEVDRIWREDVDHPFRPHSDHSWAPWTNDGPANERFTKEEVVAFAKAIHKAISWKIVKRGLKIK